MTFDLARNPRRLRQGDEPAKAAVVPQRPIGQNPLWRSLAIGSTAPSPLVQASAEVGAPDDAWEREADAVADRVMRMDVPTSPGEGVPVRTATAGLRVQRVCRAESWYRVASNYCLDTWFSPMTHPGERCYRQIPRRSWFSPCPAAQQVCFDAAGRCTESPDVSSIANERESDGACGFNEYCIGEHTALDFIPEAVGSAVESAGSVVESAGGSVARWFREQLPPFYFHGLPVRLKGAPSAPRGLPGGGRALSGILADPGRPLDAPARGFFEPRLGRNLGAVRLHTDARADRAARALGARAFAYGQDLVFARGQYDPASAAGRKLLAHELAHTLQQGTGGTEGPERLSVQFGQPDGSAYRIMRVPETAPTAPAASGPESAKEDWQGPLTIAQSAAQIMRGFLSENILIDWWAHDCRDNDKSGRYDQGDPGESGFGNHINVTRSGFRTISGRPCLGEGGTSVNIQDFVTDQPVKYSVCARVLSEAYRQAGLRGFPETNAVRNIIAYFHRYRRTRNPHTSFWLYADFPGDYQEGDFICSFDPRSQQGHAGMVVQSQPGHGLPLVVHLPGTTQRIWSGGNNGIAPYDPRQLSDMTLERWPQAARPIYGIGRYHNP